MSQTKPRAAPDTPLPRPGRASRYLHHSPVGVVAIGNTRGEVRFDPAEPLEAARRLGLRLASARSTDYRLDTIRPGSVWSSEAE